MNVRRRFISFVPPLRPSPPSLLLPPRFAELLLCARTGAGSLTDPPLPPQQYHDDGESGLGQYVASISLGSDALMTFRAKVKKQPKKGTKADDEGGVDAEDEGDEGKKDTGNKSRIVLKTRLKHGHVLIMEVRPLSSSPPRLVLHRDLPCSSCSQGADMQKLFEHKVEPEGLRFGASSSSSRSRKGGRSS